MGLLLPGSQAFSHSTRTTASCLHAAVTPSVEVSYSDVGSSSARSGVLLMGAAQESRLLTKALFWTEGYFDQDENRWLARVQTAEPTELKHPRTLRAGLRGPTGLAVDSEAQHVYWTDWSERAIIRCGVDGGGLKRINPPTGSAQHRPQDRPFGIAVDPCTDSMIWSGTGHSAIRLADLNGDDARIVSQGDTNSWSATGPWGIALHLRPGCALARARGAEHWPAAAQGLGRIFWTSWGRIKCCDLANGRVRDVVSNLIDPTGLAIDLRHQGGRLFWTDSKAGKVQCSSLDGSRVCDVASGLVQPWGIAVGPTHVFWADRRRGAIQSCCLRTGKVSDVLTGLSSPEGVAVLNVKVPAGNRAAGTEQLQRTQDAPTVAVPPYGTINRCVPRPRPSPGARQLASAAALVNQQREIERGERSRGVLRYAAGQRDLEALGLSARAPRVGLGRGPTARGMSATSKREHPLKVQDIMRLSANALAEIQLDL